GTGGHGARGPGASGGGPGGERIEGAGAGTADHAVMRARGGAAAGRAHCRAVGPVVRSGGVRAPAPRGGGGRPRPRRLRGGAAGALTFAGLAGMGDLILTATGPQSRNRSLGVELGRGRRLDDVLAGLATVAEGVNTARSAVTLAERHAVELPIAREVAEVLF